jgi:hypothetical protein
MKIKMKAGLSGPEFSLAPGDTKFFDDADEAQRLIDAGFAELAPADDQAPVSETTAERVARLKAELKVADAALKAESAAAKAAAAKPATQA